jgi:proteasome lid subunit RPN8/RPN11
MTIKFTDVSPQLDLPNWPVCNPAPVVEVTPNARAQALTHLQHRSVEQGGLLIGRAWSNPSSKSIARVEILEAIASIDSNGTEYSLKMSVQVWTDAHDRIAQLANAYANTPALSNLRIVGWFHSHPNLGAFFSSTDRATQAAFFNQPYSVGWVIDPFTNDASRHQAFFIGANAQIAQIAQVA